MNVENDVFILNIVDFKFKVEFYFWVINICFFFVVIIGCLRNI